MATADLAAAPSTGISFVCRLSERIVNGRMLVRFARSDLIANLTTLYSSVEIVSVDAVFHCRPLDRFTLSAGFIEDLGGELMPHELSDIHASLYSGFAFLTDTESITIEVKLPRGHNFGHEIRSTNLGSGPPALAAICEGVEGNREVVAQVFMDVALRCQGFRPQYKQIAG